MNLFGHSVIVLFKTEIDNVNKKMRLINSELILFRFNSVKNVSLHISFFMPEKIPP
jgi:hypothetical protein